MSGFSAAVWFLQHGRRRFIVWGLGTCVEGADMLQSLRPKLLYTRGRACLDTACCPLKNFEHAMNKHRHRSHTIMRAIKNQQRQLVPSPTADAYSNIDSTMTTQTTRTAAAINTEFSAAGNSRKAVIIVQFTLHNTKLSNSCTHNNS